MSEQTIPKITTGQYQFGLVVEPNEKVQAAVLELGYKVAIQSALMEWERQMAYPTKDGKKQKRPADLKRKDIPFTKEGADLLAKLVGLVKVDVAGDDAKEAELVDAGIMDVTAPELYEGITYTPKYGEQKQYVAWYLFQEDGKTPKTLASGGPRTLESFATNRGLTPPTEPWEEDTDFLGAVKQWQIDENKRIAASKD